MIKKRLWEVLVLVASLLILAVIFVIALGVEKGLLGAILVLLISGSLSGMQNY